MSRSKNKFTLTELLVVIAIIGILASMILPTLSKARKKGTQSVCLNNEKQCGTALLTYSFDFNDLVYTRQADGSPWSLALVENAYLPNYDATFCPDLESDSIYNSLGINIKAHSSYDNTSADILEQDNANVTSLNYARINRTTEFAVLLDSITNATTRLQTHKALSQNASSSGPHTRHNNKANTLFADGHAEALVKARLNTYGFDYGYYENFKSW